MSILNVAPENHDYERLNENSSESERLDAFFAVLAKSSYGEYVDTWKLKLGAGQQRYFESLIFETGLVKDDSGDAEQTRFILTSNGILLLKKFGSYSRYKQSFDDQREQASAAVFSEKELKNQISILTLNGLKRDAENAELERKLKDSQQRLNELNLTKRPSWKERNWFWIALVAWLVGTLTTIGIEFVKNKFDSAKDATNEIQVKQDSLSPPVKR